MPNGPNGAAAVGEYTHLLTGRGELPPELGHAMEIIDGVTRATRIAKLAPDQPVPVIVIGRYRRSRANAPRVKDHL